MILKTISARIILRLRTSADNSDLNRALKLLNWPNELSISPQRRAEGLSQLKEAFKKLLVFQQPESGESSISLPNDTFGSLLPFKVMAKDIDIRFRYHFEGNRSTNDIEKV